MGLFPGKRKNPVNTNQHIKPFQENKNCFRSKSMQSDASNERFKSNKWKHTFTATNWALITLSFGILIQISSNYKPYFFLIKVILCHPIENHTSHMDAIIPYQMWSRNEMEWNANIQIELVEWGFLL